MHSVVRLQLKFKIHTDVQAHARLEEREGRWWVFCSKRQIRLGGPGQAEYKGYSKKIKNFKIFNFDPQINPNLSQIPPFGHQYLHPHKLPHKF